MQQNDPCRWSRDRSSVTRWRRFPGVCDEGIFRARVPKIDAVNTVGCGDSMIAGFALGLSEGLSWKRLEESKCDLSGGSNARRNGLLCNGRYGNSSSEDR